MRGALERWAEHVTTLPAQKLAHVDTAGASFSHPRVSDGAVGVHP
jgi:hypothetical protein